MFDKQEIDKLMSDVSKYWESIDNTPFPNTNVLYNNNRDIKNM